MKISYIHTTDLSSKSTSANFIVFNALSLANHCEVDLFLINSSTISPAEIFSQQYGIKTLPSNLNVFAKRSPGIGRVLFYTWVIKKLRLLNPDYILTRSHGMLPYLSRWKKNRCKVFFETHDFFLDLNLRSERIKRQWKKKSRIERKYFPRIDGLICLNNSQKELYQKAFPNLSIETFPTGLSQATNKEVGERSGIIYAGSLNSRLGIDILVKLINELKQYSFTIVGGKTAKERKEFQELFAGQVLPENVEMTGWLKKSDVLDKISAGRVALLPLEDTFFNKNLTVPLKLLDYIGCATPVIASDFVSVRELISDGKHGYLVKWDDIQSVTQKIESLLNDGEVWAKKSINLQELSKHLTWEERSRRLINYLEKF